MPEFRDLSLLLDPQSIAIVGASPKERGWPARIRANLSRFKYPGRVYPVNPRYESLWGQKCYASLDELPETVDNAVFIVPAPLVVELLEQSSQPRFRTATVFSGGFGEGNDKEGLRRKEFLQAYTQEKGVRLCGPNCMGLLSTSSKAVTFPDQRLSVIEKGGLAVISQSGGLLGSLARALLGRGLGLSYFVSSGNEIDADLSDYLHYFIADRDTKVLAALVEGIREAEKFIAVATEARAHAKPILILKMGRSPKGADAALAHTGALAGNDRVFEAVCLRNGLVRVQNLDELINLAELFLTINRLSAGRKAAFVTFSGGLRALISDLAGEAGLKLPELDSRSEAELAGLLGVGSSVGNPLDTGWGGLSSQETYIKCVDILLADPGADILAVQEELPQSGARPDKESNLLALADVADRSAKPIAIFSMATQGVNEYGRRFKQRCRLPFLEGAHNAVQALKHLGNFSEAVRKSREMHFKRSHWLKPLRPQQVELLTTKRVLNEWESYQVIGQYGVAVAKTVLAPGHQEALRGAEEIGYPVVLKLVSSGATHKTELGWVRVDLRNPDEVELACREMEAAFAKANPESPLEGFLVQEMIRGGVETIIGTINDPQFGPAVMFGLGGEFVEVYQDVVFRIAPVVQEEALEMIHSIKGFPLLAGFRGKPPVDLETLSDAVVIVSELASAGAELIESVDLNPFISLAQGGKAVDALVMSR